MSYFIVTSGEDGTKIEGPFDQQEVLKRITPDQNGSTHYGSGLVCYKRIPDSDKGIWIGTSSNPMVIIKGDIVLPEVVTKITEFKLP